MMQPAPIREYKRKPLTPEVRDKLERSHRESLDLTERELRCPHCSRFIATLYCHLLLECCHSIILMPQGNLQAAVAQPQLVDEFLF